MLMCNVLLKQQNGNDHFYLVILEKGDCFFFTVINLHFIIWDQSDIRCYVHSRGECIYQTNTIVSLRIL